MFGGTGGVGAVFELSPVAGGGCSEKVIYSFSAGTGGGFYPDGGVISDAAGNLYGVTQNGGTAGSGTVFQLSPDGAGGWRESVLYSFTGSRNSGPDGAAPLGGLVFDKARQSVRHDIPRRRATAATRCRALIWDSAGNLYGTTSNQEAAISPNCTTYGTVFKLTPPTTTVGWPETAVHRFLAAVTGTARTGSSLIRREHLRYDLPGCGQADCGYPFAAVIVGPDGKLYGTASSFGAHGSGVVFQNHP